jgi:hypothetical protein
VVTPSTGMKVGARRYLAAVPGREVRRPQVPLPGSHPMQDFAKTEHPVKDGCPLLPLRIVD